MAHGSREPGRGPGAAMSHEPFIINNRLINEVFDWPGAPAGLPRAMSHEPLTINNRLINNLFDYIL